MEADNNSLNSLEDKETIEVKAIYSFFVRNRNLIFKFSIFGFIASVIYAYTSPKTWQGEFQIVMQQNINTSTSSLISMIDNPAISKFTGLGSSPNVLETQVEILKSPSILLNIFEYVKSEKNKKNNQKQINFKDWKRRLEINRTKKTSVLNLTYKDNDKDLILPTLKRISSKYQTYSGKDRRRSNELTYNYLKKQRSLYQKKSQESLNKLYNFGLKNNLSFSTVKAKDGSVINAYIDVEARRLDSQNIINILEERIKFAKTLEPNSEQMLYIASQIKELDEFTTDAININKKLQKSKELYKDSDPNLIRLKLESKTMNKLLKNHIINHFISKRDFEKAKLNASYRPEEVFNEYRNLINQSNIDKDIFQKLNRQYQIASLEKERFLDPWELITEPTLFPYPVAPKKIFAIFTGTLSMFVLSIFIAFLNEKKIFKKLIKNK